MSETKKRVRCLVFSRVVGYYQPVTNWNIGKQQEFHARKEFMVDPADILAMPEKYRHDTEEPPAASNATA